MDKNLKPKNAANLDIDALDRDELVVLCKRLVDSRETHRQRACQKAAQVKKQAAVHARLLPHAAAMIAALAEEAGMENDAAVQATIDTLGSNAYNPQDSFPVLGDAMGSAQPVDPQAGDARMVFAAPLSDIVSRLEGRLEMETMSNGLCQDLTALLEGIEGFLMDAVATGFKARAITPAPTTRHETAQPVAVENLLDASYVLSDIVQDIEFGRAFLRDDLRATFYSFQIERLIDLSRSMRDTAQAQDAA